MTQIGFVGLGKMGGNMVHRIRRDSDHEVVAFDFDKEAVKRAVADGASGAGSLATLVKKLAPPRLVWIMVPSGDPTEQTVQKLAKLLDRGDTIIDGGNSKWTEDKRRAAEMSKLGIHYVDVGTSGGVWGLEVGYCMMVGGHPTAVKRLAPILDVLAPPTNAQSIDAIGPRGWLHFGPAGAGHYVKMVHNGIEYGLMQAYAEGFDLFDKCEYELDNAKIAHLWGQGSVVRSWLCELAARAFEADGNALSEIDGYTVDSGEGRWTMEDATAHDVPTPALTAALQSRFYSRGNGDYTHRLLAALRNQFGGHAVRAASTPAAKAKTDGKPAARKASSGRAARAKASANGKTAAASSRAASSKAASGKRSAKTTPSDAATPKRGSTKARRPTKR